MLALANIVLDLPRRMLRASAKPADGQSSRELTGARTLRATAEYVHSVAVARLLALRAAGRRGPEAEAAPPAKKRRTSARGHGSR